MIPLIKILIALILLYILITAFMKISKLVLRVVIVILILGIFVFGYTSISEFWRNDEVNDINIEEIQLEESTLDDLEGELEQLEGIPLETNSSNLNNTIK
ncbi:MAG: hypothetical protein U9Q69_00775 [Nanoarchaeota archaeon]|nr:hypothetical protein [Nanoarchaeota archaeon]